MMNYYVTIENDIIIEMIYNQFYCNIVNGDTSSVMVIIIENGQSVLNSNHGQACLYTLGKGMHPTILLPDMSK